MMKVVKRKSDGVLAYRSEPPFKNGFGIKNAVALFGGKPADYEEVTMTVAQYEANPFIMAQREEAAIAAEIQRMNRLQAMINLGLNTEPIT